MKGYTNSQDTVKKKKKKKRKQQTKVFQSKSYNRTKKTNTPVFDLNTVTPYQTWSYFWCV